MIFITGLAGLGRKKLLNVKGIRHKQDLFHNDDFFR